MPAHRRKQSNAMLYTLIIFVGLFIVATTVAVFYYVKAEEYRIAGSDLQTSLNQYASEQERSDVTSLVGAQDRSASYLGTMLERFDNAISLIMGGVPAPTSAEIKINNAKARVTDLITQLTAEQYVDTVDPNLTGLAQIVEALRQKLQDTMDSEDQLQKALDDKVAEFDARLAANDEMVQRLNDDKNQLRADYNDVRLKYDDLSVLLRETTDDQVKSLQDQVDKAKESYNQLHEDFLAAQANLLETQGMLAKANKELESFGVPSRDAMAYEPDGAILSADNDSKIVYVNLGSKDHVYRGLTFSIYDKGAYIGGEGQDKAEIEIFDISDTYSAARITKSALNRPILKGDVAANLIWDNKKKNEFVIAGDFDLNDDGSIDYDAAAKIKAIVEKWGGTVTDKTSIDTDFVILGDQPQVPPQKPTLEEQQIDPTALQRYQAAVDRLNNYTKLQERAEALWIPIFTYEKFIHLIGYTSQIGQAGAF